ncbi:hypothetical protein JI62_21230 [Halomonas campaniensis]|uniref:Uncharacterized protein n=1 Tax=Halomonas campaniensis TaxID=213554 RepID=A0A246RVA1_9GAMM|nr:hypothetical protein JI62_21230 [Halomonas campaniensis]
MKKCLYRGAVALSVARKSNETRGQGDEVCAAAQEVVVRFKICALGTAARCFRGCADAYAALLGMCMMFNKWEVCVIAQVA